MKQWFKEAICWVSLAVVMILVIGGTSYWAQMMDEQREAKAQELKIKNLKDSLEIQIMYHQLDSLKR